jgi:hypothetical protein
MILKRPWDLCQQNVMHQGVDEGCRVVITADGSRVRVSWRQTPGVPAARYYYATRYY